MFYELLYSLISLSSLPFFRLLQLHPFQVPQKCEQENKKGMKHTLERRGRRMQGTKSSLEEMVENKKDETGLSFSLFPF